MRYDIVDHYMAGAPGPTFQGLAATAAVAGPVLYRLGVRR